jgi:predicted CoA-substrate-specific enzyme activase
MVTAGIDIGTRFTKIAIVDDKCLIGSYCGLSTYKRKDVYRAFRKTIHSAGLNKRSIKTTFVTGFGASSIKRFKYHRSSASCIIRSAHCLNPNIRTIIDIGALFFRVVQLDRTGSLIDVQENEKCASGSGKFLEMVAHLSGITMDDIHQMSFQSHHLLNLHHQCAVFAETEIITRLHAGDSVEDIIFSVFKSIAQKIETLIGRIEKPESEIAVCGGMATISSWMSILEDTINIKTTRLPIDPKLTSAFGAALLAANV